MIAIRSTINGKSVIQNTEIGLDERPMNIQKPTNIKEYRACEFLKCGKSFKQVIKLPLTC